MDNDDDWHLILP